MAWMNALKLLALLALMAGAPALACFGLLGCGAAAYAPAKYGLPIEQVPARRLVLANAWIELSVACAVLLGMVLGGLLVSQAAQHGAALGLAWALAALLAEYGAATAGRCGTLHQAHRKLPVGLVLNWSSWREFRRAAGS